MKSPGATRRPRGLRRARRGPTRSRLLTLEWLEGRRLLAPTGGSALALDGVNDYATAADHSSLDLGIGATEDFTLEASVYIPDAGYSGNKTLIYKQNAYGLFFNQNGLFFRLWTGVLSTDYVNLYDPGKLSVGWHHIAAVFDNEYTASQDRMALYLDGDLAASSTSVEWTPGIFNTTTALNVGGYAGINALEGWMDEVRLSDAVRYSGTTYTVPASPYSPDANTRALWHFDEAVGSTSFADSSGYGNTLTGVNGAQTGNPPGGDTTPPTVDAFSPADNATGVALGTNLVIDFSENMQKGTGNIVIKKSSDDAVVETIAVTSSQVTISNDVVTIDPSTTLAESTGYYVEVASGAFEDLAGNDFAGISGTTAWDFLTAGVVSAVLFVDDDSTATNPDGSSWDSAFPSLEEALAAARIVNGDGTPDNDVSQIRLAGGTYVPTDLSDADLDGLVDTDPRSATFALVDGVSISGGYAGLTPQAGDASDTRDTVTYVSTLSGDLEGDDTPGILVAQLLTHATRDDNAYSVVTASSATAALDGLTITGGNASVDPVNWYAPNGLGGGCYVHIGSNVSLNDVNVSGNSAKSRGGGIYNRGTVTVTHSAISGNSAGYRGAGIGNEYGTMTVNRSSILGNSAGSYGGGLANSDTMTVVGSIIAGNSSGSGGSGGGIYNGHALSVTGSTIAGNRAIGAGGIFSFGSGMVLTNSIVALNLNNGDSDVFGALSAGSGFNLTSVDAKFVRNPGPGLDGTWGSSDDDYGDLHLTERSPAINFGNNAAIPPGVTTDFDGQWRIYGGRVDIGAFEYQDAPPAGRETPSAMVTTTADGVDLYDGEISLREALFYSSLGEIAGPVTFDTGLGGREITLAGNSLMVDHTVEVDASSIGSITIDADKRSRVFTILTGDVGLIGLGITGGSAQQGGGITKYGGTTTIVNSTISGNSADWEGGGLMQKWEGTMIVIGSTISGNSTGGYGGGIAVGARMIVSGTTISGNSAGWEGGGICVYDFGGSYATLDNTIVALNATRGSYPDVRQRGALDGSHTLIGDGASVTGLTHGTDGNLIGTSFAPIDPCFVRNPSPGPDGTWGTADDDNGDLHVQENSPARDAGDNGLIPPDTYDLDDDGNVAEPIPFDVDGNARIVNGTVDMGAHEWTAEVIPPTVDSLNPADNATGVALDTNLVIDFSENVQKGTGDIVIRKLSDDSAVETIDVTSAVVTVSGPTVVIDPSTTLAESTGYYVEATAGAFEDLAGNDFAGISGTTAWNFTTGDFTPPTVSSLSPVDNATGVATNTNLVITFSEDIQQSTGNIVLRRSRDDSVVETIDVTSSAVTMSGPTVTIDPSTMLADSTGYYVEVARGAFDDLAGNDFAGITGKTAWNFTTGDFTPPTVSSLSPMDNAADVAMTTNLVIMFSEDVRRSSGNILIKRSNDDSEVETIDVTSAAVTVSGPTVVIDPSTTLAASTGYCVEVTAGAFEDLAGNDFSGISDQTTWNFITTDATPPTVTDVSPFLQGGMLPAGVTSLQITFGESVVGGHDAANYQLQSLGADALLGTGDDSLVPLSASYADTTVTLSFASLPASVYGLTVRDTITDSSGIALDGNGDGIAGGDWMANFVAVTAIDSLFGSATTFSVGGDSPTSPAAADFNGDGYLDLAVANFSSNNVGVLLGFGGGAFLPTMTYSPGGSWPRSVTVGDFNGDGDPDIAVPNAASGTVGVLLGEGDGTFGGPVVYSSAGATPDAVAVSDFDEDGHQDMAVVNQNGCNVALLLGYGDGTFVNSATYSSGGSYSRSVRVGDFNVDGHADLVVANEGSGTVGVLLGRGDGTFGDVEVYSARGNSPWSVAVADFNGDGQEDLVTSNYHSNTVSVLLGRGDGTFAQAATHGTGGTNPMSVAAADFNGDGHLDVAVTNWTSEDVGILLGRGDGTLAAATMYESGGLRPKSVIAADLNDDARSDIAIANWNSDNVGVLLNTSSSATLVLDSPHGLSVDIQSGGYMAGQLIQGPDNAFDGLNRLQVTGSDYAPPPTTSLTLDDGGRTLVTATQSLAGLSVHREITVPMIGNEDFARTVDVFENLTASSITTTVRIVGNLGSDAATTVFGTFDGDTLVEPSDQWIGTDDADGMGTPAIIHYIHGPAGLVPSAVSISGDRGDNIEWTYDITVPAGGTLRLAYFTILADTQAGAEAAAATLITPSGFGGEAAAFLTPEELESIANFDPDWTPSSSVAGRYIFYNNSKWDAHGTFTNGDPVANAYDDAAIALDKQALLDGQKATFANYTSYSRGINGIMVDIAGLADPARLSVADFEFRTGNDNDPAGWPLLALDPTVITVAVRPGEGADGSDRVTIVFPDGAVKKTWLQVTVKATDVTGLAAPDLHYWGNAIGDSGNSATDTAVNVVDALGVRANPHTLLNPAPIDDAYDFNRDKQVNVQDELIVRANPTTLLTDLNLIDLTGSGDGAGEGEGQWNGDAWGARDGGRLFDPSMTQEHAAPPAEPTVPLITSSDLLCTVASTNLTPVTRSTAMTSRRTPFSAEDLVPQDTFPDLFTLPVVPFTSTVGNAIDVSATTTTLALGGDDLFHLTNRTNWAQDADSRNRRRTLDEALQELLAEWEQL